MGLILLILPRTHQLRTHVGDLAVLSAAARRAPSSRVRGFYKKHHPKRMAVVAVGDVPGS